MHENFHIIQDFLRVSEIGFALTNPIKVSARSVLHIWKKRVYSDGQGSQPQSITFTHGGNKCVSSSGHTCSHKLLGLNY